MITLNELPFFSIFLVIIMVMLFIDLGVFSKKSHVVSLKESMAWTIFWIALAIGFYFLVRHHGELIHNLETYEDYVSNIHKFKHPVKYDGLALDELRQAYDHNLAKQYLTGYLIEKSLSLDNIFVILLIFISFNVPEKYYKRVLFWGILGAIVMRFVFIFALSAIIYRFEWVLLIFGAMLIYLAIKMLLDFIRKQAPKIDVEHHPMVRFSKRLFPVHPRFEEGKFFHRVNGKLFITPLFIALMVVEFSDLVFAVDSIPAIFAVSRDPYIVFYSNIFAILGLRSLFFVVSHFFHKFYYLKIGLAALLGYVGIKIILPFINHDWKIGTDESLIIISAILGLSIVASLIFSKREG